MIKRRLPPIYDRAALTITPAQRQAAEAAGKSPHWRFKLSEGAAGWTDLVLGARHVKLATISDPVLLRADGTPLYTFTSVVDDLDHAITHIIRGEDHVTNTAVQIDLFRALAHERPLPRFAHMPLISDVDGAKLSKRIGSITLRSLRKDGIEPAAITAYLARLGTSKDLAPLSLAELSQSFSFNDFSRSPPRFDPPQLLAVNAKILHNLPFDVVRARLPEAATEAFWLAVRGNLELLSEARPWWNVVAGEITPPEVTAEDHAVLAPRA